MEWLKEVAIKPGAVSKAMIGELRNKKKSPIRKRNFDNSWKVKAGHAKKGDDIEKVFKSYVLGDPYLFDLILDEGEFIQPIQVIKQNHFKWPNFSSNGYFEKFFNYMPEPYVTYLKTSEFRTN